MWAFRSVFIGLLVGAFGVAALEGQSSSGSAKSAGQELDEQLAAAGRLVSQGERHFQAGELDTALKELTEAAKAYEDMRGLARMVDRLLGRAHTLALMGDVYAKQNQLATAFQNWQQALELYQPVINSGEAFWKASLRSDSAKTVKDAAFEIIGTFHKAIEVLAAANRQRDAQSWTLILLDFCQKLPWHEEELRSAERLAAMWRDQPASVEQNRALVRALVAASISLINLGQPAPVLDKVDEASKIVNRMEEDSTTTVERANIEFAAGAALQALNRQRESRAALTRAMNLYSRSPGSQRLQGQCLERLQASYNSSGMLVEAIEAGRKELALYAALPDGEADVYRVRQHLAVFFGETSNYERAEEEFQAAEKLADHAQIDPKSRVSSYANMAVMYRESGDHEKALADFQKAIEFLEKVPGSEKKQAEYMIDVAVAQQALERPEEGRETLEKGLGLLARVPDSDIVRIRLQRLLAQDTASRLKQPDVLVQECRRIVREFSGNPEAQETVLICRVDVGRELTRRGLNEEAAEEFEQAKLLAQRAAERAGTGIDGDPEAVDLRRRVAINFGLSLFAANRMEAAAREFDFASQLGVSRFISNLLKMNSQEQLLFRNLNTMWEVANRLSIAMCFGGFSDPREGYGVALSQKGLYTDISRLQRDILLRNQSPATARARSRYLQLRQSVSRRVLDWQSGSDLSSEAEAEEVGSLFKQIRVAESEFIAEGLSSIGETGPRIATPEAAATNLRKGEVLLEYVRYQPLTLEQARNFSLEATPAEAGNGFRYGVFTIFGSPYRVVPIDLGPAGTIDQLIAEYRTLQRTQSILDLDDEKELARIGEKLRDLLLIPVLKKAGQVTRMYIAPDGQISLIPFEALPFEVGPDRITYMVEHHEFIYLSTGRDLARAASASRASSAPLLIGNPAFDAKPEDRLATLGSVVGKAPPAPATTTTQSPVAGPISRNHLPEGWPAIEGTGEILRSISEVARKAGLQPRALEGAAASEENLWRLASPRFLVFATHGFFMDWSPRVKFTLSKLQFGGRKSTVEGLKLDQFQAADPLMRSMLVLAGANQRRDRVTRFLHNGTVLTSDEAGQQGLRGDELEDARFELGDGLLTAYEVWGLDLRGTDIVALIACETGIGVVQGGKSAGLEQPRGEVVAGLRQAFIVAGAQSEVMSLWEVPRKATGEQMQAFFGGWLGAGLGRYQAFRAGQLEALRRARAAHEGSGHPFWWAGFIYTGNPGDRLEARR